MTLRGGSLGATVGLAGGQIHLLPEPDEDPEIWRKRCERAWIKDPNQRIDTLRMREIAFAAPPSDAFHHRIDAAPSAEQIAGLLSRTIAAVKRSDGSPQPREPMPIVDLRTRFALRVVAPSPSQAVPGFSPI